MCPHLKTPRNYFNLRKKRHNMSPLIDLFPSSSSWILCDRCDVPLSPAHGCQTEVTPISFIVKSQWGGSITPAALPFFTQPSAFPRIFPGVLSNDLVKGLNLITLRLGWTLGSVMICQAPWGTAQHQRHNNTHWLNTNLHSNPSWLTCFL